VLWPGDGGQAGLLLGQAGPGYAHQSAVGQSINQKRPQKRVSDPDTPPQRPPKREVDKSEPNRSQEKGTLTGSVSDLDSDPHWIRIQQT